MSLPAGFLDELRNRVSLAQVVGRSITWDQRKSNAARGDWWAPCPFHQEKTASFHVDDAKGYYYCFGCQAKGDVVDFVRQTENLGFIEAVERLALDAGMAMPSQNPAAAARAAANQGLSEAMEAAVRFYTAQLTGSRATEARAYLARRGLDAEACERFGIGFAPDGRSVLLDHLTAKGFPLKRLAEAGLVGIPDDGRAPYDRFRGRITFPIRDGRGRAIAFGARAVAPDQQPKYLNSPETPIFDKSRTLYNLGPAQAAAGRAGTLIVAEGYMDVIALVQAGFEHAVAPLGTAITEGQLALLWKAAPEPVIALDGDRAGLAAAHRLIDLALPHLGPERSLRFVLLPEGRDPDDVIRAGGAEAMAALLAESKPVIDIVWARETEGRPLDSPERRSALDARLRAVLARIADAGLRAHWEREIRSRRAALWARPRAVAPDGPRSAGTGGRGSRARAAVAPTSAARASLLARPDDGPAAETRIRESAILAGCLNHPAVALSLEERLERLVFACPDLAALRDALLSALADGGDDVASVQAAVAARVGTDPLPGLAVAGRLRANRHLGPAADPAVAERAIVEELTRHAALTARAAELRDAALDLDADPDEAITLRVRAAAEAEQSANIRPLEDDGSDDEAERLEFASIIQFAETSKSRKPRNR